VRPDSSLEPPKMIALNDPDIYFMKQQANMYYYQRVEEGLLSVLLLDDWKKPIL
jgi:hypothetical protein